MRPLNGFFGNGPGNGDDTQSQKYLEAYNRNRLQMNVATSTFAGVALVGMFCSCLWFVCCRNSSSKTRKKARTWNAGSTDSGLPNAYSYDGYLDAQGYMHMNDNEGCVDAGGVAPYISNPLYHPNSLYPNDTGFANDYFGFNNADKGQMMSLASEGTTFSKDVPPSYTALFFAATDPYSGIGGNKGIGAGAGVGKEDNPVKVSSEPRVTSIQPIHLKVTSNTHDGQLKMEKETLGKNAGGRNEDPEGDDDDDSYQENFVKKENSTTAPPVSLLSVESDPEKEPEGEKDDKVSQILERPSQKAVPPHVGVVKDSENAPPYNPGYKGYNNYKRF